MKACRGMDTATTSSSWAAMRRTLSEVLYSRGASGAKKAMMTPTPAQRATEKAMSFRSSSTARSSSPAPSSCPTMMAMALPMERKAQKKRLETVEEMFTAETTSSPRME